MSIFSRKKKVNVEDFCRDFYDNYIFNPTVGKDNVGSVLPDYVISEVDPLFTHIDKHKLTEELMTVQLELFALAWIHKFSSGKLPIAQSVFTKQYLNEKGRNDIWNTMKSYSEMIYSGTLHWITSLGKMNLITSYHTQNMLTAANSEGAKKLGIDPSDDIIARVNLRILSEMAWKQKITHGGLAGTFCKQLGLNRNELKKEVGFRLAGVFNGFYDGVKQSLGNVKIIEG